MVYTVLLDSHNPAGTQIEEDELSEMVQNGSLLATTQVWNEESGRWIDAQSHPGLYSLFAQSLWDAWDEDAHSTISEAQSIKKEEVDVAQPILEES